MISTGAANVDATTMSAIRISDMFDNMIAKNKVSDELRSCNILCGEMNVWTSQQMNDSEQSRLN